MIIVTCPSQRMVVLSSIFTLLSYSLAVAQGERDLRAERLVVDDDNGHTIAIQAPHTPAPPMSANYIVTIPEPSVAGTTFLLSHPSRGSSAQSINGSITVADTVRADDLESARLMAPPSGSMRVQSNGSITVGIDEDNNGTGSSFAVESNGAATPDLFRVTETGLTDVSSTSSTGAFRVTNTNASGTAKILELLDGSAAQFTVRRNGSATLAGDLAVDGAGTSSFAGSVSIGDFMTLMQENQTALPVNASLVPNASHILVAGGSGSVTLSGTTAIANGSAVGQILLLIGNSDANTVTVNDGANVQCAAGANRTLGRNDVLTLLWNGTDWLEVGFADN